MNFSPYKILIESIKYLPALKYALGVVGLAAAVSIIVGFGIDYRVAVFGIIILIGLMTVLVVFVYAVSHSEGPWLKIVAIVMIYSFTILTIITSFLLMTCFFFSWPKSIESYIHDTTTTISVENISDNKLNNSIKNMSEMILIPKGSFLMGTTENEVNELVKRYPQMKDWLIYETPQQRLKLDSFYISKNEITNELYGIFLESTGYNKPLCWADTNFNKLRQPVVGVSWYGANFFCEWLSNKTNFIFRLPTEAEWEKAAKGKNNLRYPWGNNQPDSNYANFSKNVGKPRNVGSYPSGKSWQHKLMDMSGNVAEWCSDTFYERHTNNTNELHTSNTSNQPNRKVIRGGSWFESPFYLRCAARQHYPPAVEKNYIGFRVVREQ